MVSLISDDINHEYKLHHLVNELVSLLHITEGADVESHVELLMKSRTPYITKQVLLLAS